MIMNKWKLIRILTGIVLSIVFVLLIMSVSVAGTLGTMPPSGYEEMDFGEWAWLVQLAFLLVEYMWVLVTLIILLVAATAFCRVMEYREERFSILKLSFGFLSDAIMLAVALYSLQFIIN